MNRYFLLAASVSLAGMLAACSSPHEMTTRDGQTIVTSDRPDVDDDKDFITYERDGNETRINKSEVRDIREID
ncbi:YgdI/YgdR family lipoprotein [Pusillimonas sp. (ex Stolz et al. 2005)]|uniref:YgdI/YgdR family lipoprotein n=1 Tax=Pusillimonas sp. (ex Stolz et al. 2005) TaxID=1979962 RepID=UPI0026249BC7|nr:YgdI/YgdR family lipoprotein [Pusillimonas sp. (ex Stolz et al. 2005)]